jgi:hypothetical protein
MAIALILSGTMATGAALAAPPPGKGKPPVETANNLSYPGALTATGAFTLPIGYYDLGAVFPNGMSYGCNVPETIGTSVYPNTSCVNDVGTPLTPEACVATKCIGFTEDQLEPIYWQKNTANKWQAGYVSGLGSATADFVDWGDNLESVSWKTTSILRVETNAFTTLAAPTVRFDMWHVFGQGTNELWGAHANNANVPYVYAGWPYGVINTPNARLNIAKLTNGPATCPTTGGAVSPFSPTWANGWTGTWLLRDIPYTAELNIKGSYVFGFNWNLKSDSVPPEVNKAGWWRLTFYTSDNSVVFDDANIPTAPPTSDLVPLPAASITVEAEEGDTGPLYAPVVDVENNLTYIDICINEGNSKGGGGKNK